MSELDDVIAHVERLKYALENLGVVEKEPKPVTTEDLIEQLEHMTQWIDGAHQKRLIIGGPYNTMGVRKLIAQWKEQNL